MLVKMQNYVTYFGIFNLIVVDHSYHIFRAVSRASDAATLLGEERTLDPEPAPSCPLTHPGRDGRAGGGVPSHGYIGLSICLSVKIYTPLI